VLLQPENILTCLDRHQQLAGPRRYVVAFSGGLDSTVLLDLTRRALPRQRGADLLAVHVDHNLQAASTAWAKQCEETATLFGVAYESCQVQIETRQGESPEAAARNARYAALCQYIGPGDVLMTGHHRDDQLETVLLQLMRGAGVAGLAGMAECSRYQTGWRLRPLLSVDRVSLLAYAEQSQLQWIDDPTNTDSRYDRNFLRHEVVPLLGQRWPGVAAAVARSARHSAAAVRLLRELGSSDASFATANADALDLKRLGTLSVERQQNALRYWLLSQSLSIPTTAHLQQIDQLIHATSAAGCVSWSGGEVRRYRNQIYAMQSLPAQPAADFHCAVSPDSVVTLPAGLGQVRCATVADGLDPQRYGDKLSLRFRAGGEKLRPAGSAHRRELRNLFQEAGIVPWMRDRIPLLYAGDRLAAVAGLWVEQDLAAGQGAGGLGLIWEDHPPLY